MTHKNGVHYKDRAYFPGEVVWITHVPSGTRMFGTLQDFATDEMGFQVRMSFPFAGVQWITIGDEFTMEPA